MASHEIKSMGVQGGEAFRTGGPAGTQPEVTRVVTTQSASGESRRASPVVATAGIPRRYRESQGIQQSALDESGGEKAPVTDTDNPPRAIDTVLPHVRSYHDLNAPTLEAADTVFDKKVDEIENPPEITITDKHQAIITAIGDAEGISDFEIASGIEGQSLKTVKARITELKKLGIVGTRSEFDPELSIYTTAHFLQDHERELGVPPIRTLAQTRALIVDTFAEHAGSTAQTGLSPTDLVGILDERGITVGPGLVNDTLAKSHKVGEPVGLHRARDRESRLFHVTYYNTAKRPQN